MAAKSPLRSSSRREGGLRSTAALALFLAGSLALAGCAGAAQVGPDRSVPAEKWLKRAQTDFSEGRIDEAHDAVSKALAAAPEDTEIKTLAGRIALTRLEFDETLRLLKDIPGAEARGIRGRAYWYRGDLGPAADELEALLEDPDVHDDWAKPIAGLARRGQGRTPFAISGAQVAAVDMANVNPAPFLVIPIEVDGVQTLAMVSTGIADVVIDSATRAEPSWVSLRFGGSLEVSDVPALTKDLSGLSKELNAPIGALLGSSVLRRVNATMDYAGHQFVARAYAPPPPPHATRIPLYYARGEGMMMSTPIGTTNGSAASLFVDSALRFPIALDERGWVKAGVLPKDLSPVEAAPDLKEGIVPLLKLGSFELRKVPGVLGDGGMTTPIADIEKGFKQDLDGVLGAFILANYRLTLADGGRTMWLEDDTGFRIMMQQLGAGGPPSEEPAGGGAPKNEAE
ncbi:MAG: tetratricopeptide repeat protein [Myxococcales bacterium]|nr:tetratricopeptide repeat protein [Myxococcales bacterium]